VAVINSTVVTNQETPHQGRLRNRDLIYGKAKKFFTSPKVQTGSGAHRDCYSVGTGVSFPTGRPGPESDHSPPFGIGIKNEWR
jgi:hypothetical protein